MTVKRKPAAKWGAILPTLLLLLMLGLQSSDSSARIYEYDVPEKITIAFSGNGYKKYLNLLNEADSVESMNIGEEYKKFLKIFGTYHDQFGQEHLFSGRARITGDFKDHLEPSKRLSSLSITLKQGNIGGVVKFRLLIPETREGDNEIFWSLLMEELGYPVPYRSMIKVNLMGTEHEFIFEEKPEKEFLESNGFREGPIIESDERQLWSNMLLTRSWGRWLDQVKIKNSDFLKNRVAYEIAYRSLDPKFGRNEFFGLYDKVNKKYASHGVTTHNRKYLYDVIYNDYLPIYFDGDVFKGQENICDQAGELGSEGSKSEEVESKLKVLEAKFRDRTFESEFNESFQCVARDVFRYFGSVEIKFGRIKPLSSIERRVDDDLSSAILREKGLRFRPPVYSYNLKNGSGMECFYIHPSGRDYVDRYPDLLGSFNSGPSGMSKEEWGERHYRKYGGQERRDFFDSAVDAALFEHYVDRYPDLLDTYEKSETLISKAKWGYDHFFRMDGFRLGRNIYGESDGEVVIEAIEDMIEEGEPESTWANCEPLSNKKLKKIFSGEEKPVLFGSVPYYGFLNIDYSPAVDEFFHEMNVSRSNSDIDVPSGITYIKLSADDARINIRLLSDDAFLVFYNSKITSSQINVASSGSNLGQQEVRYNTKLLTSCVTLIDSEVRDSKFSSNSCSREDAINFIRVNGASVSLDIEKAANDGFDADFSNVQFESVRVDQSGNDCIDLSAGVYNLQDVVLTDCGDKAVSAGERSYVSLKNVEISGADIGLASKDHSYVYLTGQISIKKTRQCLSAYQKKQEFGPAEIRSLESLPACGFNTPNKGYFKIGSSCEFVDRTYFFNVCVRDAEIEIISNRKPPKDHFLVLEARSKQDDDWEKVVFKNSSDSHLDNCLEVGCLLPLQRSKYLAELRIGLVDKSSGFRSYSREINRTGVR